MPQPMPQVQAQGKRVEREEGTNLRQILLQQGIDLDNNLSRLINSRLINSRLINYRGLGPCGAGAVQLAGMESIQGCQEQALLSLLSHSPMKDRRLACQTQVLGNLRVVLRVAWRVAKYNGFWGQGDRPIWTPEG